MTEDTKTNELTDDKLKVTKMKIGKLKLKRGDVLVLQFGLEDAPSNDILHNIRQQMQLLLPVGVKVACFLGDIELKVLEAPKG